jgi:hypothetical protein
MIFEGGSAQLLFGHDAPPIWKAKLFAKTGTTLQSVAPSRLLLRQGMLQAFFKISIA